MELTNLYLPNVWLYDDCVEEGDNKDVYGTNKLVLTQCMTLMTIAGVVWYWLEWLMKITPTDAYVKKERLQRLEENMSKSNYLFKKATSKI